MGGIAGSRRLGSGPGPGGAGCKKAGFPRKMRRLCQAGRPARLPCLSKGRNLQIRLGHVGRRSTARQARRAALLVVFWRCFSQASAFPEPPNRRRIGTALREITD